MPARLVALDQGPDIMVGRAMLVTERHLACDAWLDSLRLSRRHCCMIQENREVVERDLGSTNGIRINGQRVERSGSDFGRPSVATKPPWRSWCNSLSDIALRRTSREVRTRHSSKRFLN
jgi:pSer/pThr/pTyr-binding forkhead associated (FHA) protein